MSDVFAGEGVKDERILERTAAGLWPIDFGEGEDFAGVSAGIEAPREEPLVIGGGLARECQELR